MHPTHNPVLVTRVSVERKRTIFVVDDRANVANTTAAIFDRFGFCSRAFTNPLDAIESADSECPDLLLSDVVMPELSGIELAIIFKEKFPKCRVLLFSGQTETSNLLESARKAGHHFPILAKPVHPTELLVAIEVLSPRDEQY
jgi:DNA-binding NtrC family response regulator